MDRKPVFEHHRPATLEFRCAVGYPCDDRIAEIVVTQGKYAQYDNALFIKTRGPRKRRWEMRAYGDGLAYFRVVDDLGQVLWDSRTIIPMEKLSAENEARFGVWGT